MRWERDPLKGCQFKTWLPKCTLKLHTGVHLSPGIHGNNILIILEVCSHIHIYTQLFVVVSEQGNVGRGEVILEVCSHIHIYAQLFVVASEQGNGWRGEVRMVLNAQLKTDHTM